MEITETDLNGQLPMCRMEKSFREFINYEFVKPFRKHLIHVLKNFAYHGQTDNFFNLDILDRQRAIRYEKDLILNQVTKTELKIEVPTYIPGVVIPLDEGWGPFINLRLCVSTCSEGYWNNQYELQFQVRGSREIGRIKVTPGKLYEVLEYLRRE
ncbi:hypothetical protein PQD71_gp005 [Kosakonia phage Kc263]|uniref:Uncharacterized protein n=1 Tax=Kosakonia phage Kc263 TaxID=2863194 RepID=A0AAE8BFF2_9CAUD|nr:hypothetical protein PQD71_gp005 [Kosakonia phage Kc263]QYN79898.1 hypothetical protein [Kosakonia phage Kc263]